jgi:hypothetical protein
MKTRIQAGTMIHRLFLVIGLGLLAIGPTLADVVDVSVNDSISGLGSVTTYCLVPEECFSFLDGQMVTFPFSFSATNTHLGVFVASGGVSSPGPPETNYANIRGACKAECWRFAAKVVGVPFMPGFHRLWRSCRLAGRPF